MKKVLWCIRISYKFFRKTTVLSWLHDIYFSLNLILRMFSQLFYLVIAIPLRQNLCRITSLSLSLSFSNKVVLERFSLFHVPSRSSFNHNTWKVLCCCAIMALDWNSLSRDFHLASLLNIIRWKCKTQLFRRDMSWHPIVPSGSCLVPCLLKMVCVYIWFHSFHTQPILTFNSYSNIKTNSTSNINQHIKTSFLIYKQRLSWCIVKLIIIYRSSIKSSQAPKPAIIIFSACWDEFKGATSHVRRAHLTSF